MSRRIGFWHLQSGDALTIHLFLWSGGSPVTPEEGVEAEEVNAESTPGYYEASVDDLPIGNYRARVFREAVLVFDGALAISDLETVTVIGITVPVPPPSIVSAFSTTALSQLLPYRSIGVAVPAISGDLLTPPLIQGDSYLADHGRAITFSRADFPEIPSGSHVRLLARQLDDPLSRIELEGDVSVTTGIKVVRFEVTSAESALWKAGQYAFHVEVEFPDGNSATFIGPDTRLRVVPQF